MNIRLGALSFSQLRCLPLGLTTSHNRRQRRHRRAAFVREPTHAGVCACRRRRARCVTTQCGVERMLRLAWRCTARICPVSEPWCTSRLETRASPGNAPDPNVAPASARWLAATLPAAYVPPALLEELLGESLTQEAERRVCAAP